MTCLVGGLTLEMFVACTNRLVQILKQARVIHIADATHAVHIDQLEKFVSAVLSAIATGA